MNYKIAMNFNCQYSWAIECVESIKAQKFDGDVKIFALDDASKDVENVSGYDSIVKEVDAVSIRNIVNMGAAKARWDLINIIMEDTPKEEYDSSTIVFIDGDDCFFHDEVLDDLEVCYNGDAKMVFGWINGHTQPKYTEKQKQEANYYNYPWAVNSIRTCRLTVLDNVNLQPSHFQFKGKWITHTSDQALWLPILEQFKPQGNDLQYVSRPNLFYRMHPENDHVEQRSRSKQLWTEKLCRDKKLDFHRTEN